MSLRSIIQKKDSFSDNLLKKFDKQWVALSPQLQKDIISLFKTGDYSVDAIQFAFAQNGLDDLVGETARQFNKVIGLSKEISKELGYNFLLTEENIDLFEQMAELPLDTFYANKASIARDMKRFAIESQIENRSVKEIRLGLDGLFEKMGRNLNTEIYTGVRNFESALDKVSMQNGGITKFQYIGPFDGKTRNACKDTLSDKKNSTGFTAEEVENSSTPFIDRGGPNCRHRWVAFVEGF